MATKRDCIVTLPIREFQFQKFQPFLRLPKEQPTGQLKNSGKKIFGEKIPKNIRGAWHN
jgi:hypothetical protein